MGGKSSLKVSLSGYLLSLREVVWNFEDGQFMTFASHLRFVWCSGLVFYSNFGKVNIASSKIACYLLRHYEWLIARHMLDVCHVLVVTPPP